MEMVNIILQQVFDLAIDDNYIQGKAIFYKSRID